MRSSKARARKNLPTNAPHRDAADDSVAPDKFAVKEIMYTTDYKSFFKTANSKAFMSGYTKNVNTQLAWKMEAVPRSAYYPLGVRTMYKVSGDIYSSYYIYIYHR